MYKVLQRGSAWVLLACLPLVISGCGGVGGGAAQPATTISGIAMKGPINQAIVQIFQLTPAGAPGALLGSGTSDAAGNFGISIPSSKAAGPLMITVSGHAGSQYLSETTNLSVDFRAGESFSAVVATPAASPTIAVTPLTEAAYQKLQQVLTENPSLATAGNITGAVEAANQRIAALFGVADVLAPPAGDPQYLAGLQIIDQLIVDGGASTNTATVMNVINQAYSDVTAPAYQSFVESLAVAADKVIAANPGDAALISAIGEVKVATANPAPELDFSDTTAPSAAASLAASASALNATTSSVVLAWSASTDNTAVTGYDVFRNGSKTATVKTLGYTDTVTSNVTYTYTVVAFDAIGNRSAASNQVSITPIPASLVITVSGQVASGILNAPFVDNVPPTAPVILSAVPAAISATYSSVLLSWSAATDNVQVTGYDVFRNGSKIATVTVGATYADPSVASGVSYTYTVVAFDAVGNRSTASNQLAVTPVQAALGVTVGGQVLF